MTTSPRPHRPAPLVGGLVLIVLAALFHGMNLNATAGPTGPNSNSLGSLILLTALLAIRFNWARVTTAILLSVLTFFWLPPALAVLGDDVPYDVNAVSYVIIAAVLTAAGGILVFLPASNDYYAHARAWREHRRLARRQVQS